MSNIVPSILEKNFEKIEEVSSKFLKLQNKVDRIEIDICDGVFVKNKTWIPEVKIDPYLPNWELFNYTAHLMVANPQEKIETLALYGFDRIVFSYGTFLDGEFSMIKEKCRKYEIEIYVALQIKDDVLEFKNFVKNNLQDISGLQIMCIEKVGFQKQKMSEKSLEIIKDLRSEFPNTNICVDGGINLDTIKACKDSGANEFVVGSFLVNSDEIKDDFNALSQFL